MTQQIAIETGADYVNYTFNMEARGVAEVSSELMGLSNTVSNILGQIAFKTSDFLSHTEMMAIGAGAAIGAMFVKASQSAINFQQQIANVKAIGGETIDAQGIGSAAMEYSNKFGMATSEMTEGLESLARAGITSTNVMKQVLGEGVKLSKLEGLDLEDSINDLIATTNLLSEMDVDMNDANYGQLVQAMNQHIVSTSESSPINAQNIIQTLQHVGGYAAAASIDQDDLFAVIAQLGARGTKGEMAGTALRAFIAAPQKDTAQRALDRIGLNVFDLWDESGEAMLPISEVKDVLDDALEKRGYSKQEKLEFYSDFAGYKQANQIMKINTEEVRKYKDDIANAWDLGTKLNTILGTVRGNLDRIWQISQNFMTKVGSQLLIVAEALLTPVRVFLDIFTHIPFADTAVAGIMLFTAFKGGLLIVNKTLPLIASFSSNVFDTAKNSLNIKRQWEGINHQLEKFRNIKTAIQEEDYKTLNEYSEPSRKEKIQLENMVFAQMWRKTQTHKGGVKNFEELPLYAQERYKRRVRHSENFEENYNSLLERIDKNIDTAIDESIDFNFEDAPYKVVLDSISKYVEYIYRAINGEGNSNRDRNAQANILSEVFRNRVDNNNYGNLEFKYRGENGVNQLKWDIYRNSRDIKQRARDFDNVDAGNLTQAQINAHLNAWIGASNKGHQKSTDANISEIRMVFEKGELAHHENPWEGLKDDQIKLMAKSVGLSGYEDFDSRHGGNRAHAARDIYQEFQRQHGNKSLTEQRSIIDRFFEQENDNGETLVKIWQRNFDRPARGPKEILLNRNDIGKKLAEQLGIQTSIGNETYDVFDYIQAHKDNLTEQQKYIIAQTTFLGTQLDNGSTIFQDNQLKFMLEQREMLLNTAKDFDIHADVLGLSDSIRDEVKEVIEAMNADSETLRSGGEALGRALVEGFIVDGLGRHSPGYMFWAYVNEQTDINNAILQSKGIFNESTGLLGLEMTKTFDKNLGLNRVFDSGIEFLSRDADVVQSIISDFDKDNFAVYDPQDLVHTDGTIWEQVDMQDELNLTPEEIISIEQFVRPYGFDVSNFERFGKNFGTQWGQKPRFQSALWYSDYDLLNNSVFLYSDLEDKYGHENISDFSWLVEEFRHKHGGNWLGFKTSGNIGDFTIDDEIFNDIVQDIENKYFDFLNNIGQNMRNVIKRSDGLFEDIKLSRGGRLPTTADEMGEYLGFTSTSFSPEMVERVYGVGGAHQYKTNIFAPEEVLGIYPNIETIGRSLILRDGSELNNVYKNQLEYTLGSGQPFIELPNKNGDFSGKALKREPDVLLLTPSQIKEIRNIVVDEMSDIINSQSNKKVSDILNSKGLDIASNLNSFQNKGEDISIDDYLLQLDEARKYAKIRNDLQKRRNKKNNKDTGWALNVIKSRYNTGESMPYSSSVLLGESDYYTDLSYINKPGYTEDRVYDLFDTSWLNVNHSRYTDGPMGESYGTGHAFLNPGAIKYHIDNYSEEYGNDYGTALLENIVHEATHILADHDMRSSEAYKELYLGGIDDFTTDEDILGYNSNFVAEFEANYVAVKTLEKLGLEASQKAQQRMATFKRMVDNQELENSYNLELLDSLVDSFIMHRADLLSYVKGMATQFDMVSADTNKMEVVNSLRNVEMALDNTTRSRSVYYGGSIESSYDADKIVSDMAIDILSLNPTSYGIDTYEDILKQSIISKYAPIIGLKNAQKGYKYANKRATSESILDFNSFLLDNFHKEDFIKPELNSNYISSSSDAFNYKWDNNSIKKYMSDLYQSDYQDKTTFGTPAEIEAYSQLLHSKSSLMKNFTETNFSGYESAWVDNYIDSDGLANEKVIYIKNAVEYLNRLFEHSPGAYDNQLLYHGGTLNTNLGGFGQFNLRSLTYDEATSKDHAYSSGRYHQKVYVPAGTQILNPTHSLLGSGWYENESEATVGVAQPYFELNRRGADYRSNKPNKAEVLLLGPNQQKDFLDSIGLKSFKNEGNKDNEQNAVSRAKDYVKKNNFTHEYIASMLDEAFASSALRRYSENDYETFTKYALGQISGDTELYKGTTIEEAYGHLQKLIQLSSLDDNLILYRGGHAFDTDENGQGRINKISSTSADKGVAELFQDEGYLTKIYAPKGIHALYNEKTAGGFGNTLEDIDSNEHEFILNENQPFIELSRDDKNKTAEILLLTPEMVKDFEKKKESTSKQITLDDVAKQDKEKNTNKASKFCECLRQNMYKEQAKRHHEVKREKYRKQLEFEDIKERTRRHHHIRKEKSDALLKEKERQEKLEELKEKTRNHHKIRKEKNDALMKQRKRDEEIASLRKQMAADDKRWLEEGKKYAEEKVRKQRELRERQKKIYQDERKEREEEYIRKRRQEYSHIYGVGVQNAPEDLVKQQQYEEDVAQHSTPGYSSQAYADFQNQYAEMGDYFLMNNFDKARYKLQQEGKDNKWIMKGIDYSERIYNQATNKVRSFTSGQYEKSQQYAQEHGHENLDWASDKLDIVKQGTEQFRDSLASLSEIFPVLTPAVMALDTALAIQEAVSTGLTVATEILTFAKTGETESTFLQTMANWANSESALQAAAGEMVLAGATWLASAAEAVLAFLRGLSSAQILLVAAAIAAVIAAIMAIKFWEEQHAKALKESQKALEEATAKNNIALSQYQDLKKARENETDAIKKQQAARKEAIALYELEAARLKKRQAVHDEAEARNDAVWGEYGLRATMQKMGLGFIAGGDFKSQYENYEGTTKNIRKVKEDTLGNFETTQEQQYVAAFYDANKMAFAEIDAYKEDLGKLYDVESKLIEKYGSIEDARNSQEFADAVQEFCDATGIQAETAVKYLDWLETENKVNQASKVAEASIAMVRARADAKAAGIDMEYGGFDSENMDDVGRAMVYAQVDQMIKDEKHEMWWTMLWEYLQAIISCLFLNFGEAGKHLQKAEAYQEGVAELEANREQYYQDAMDYYENADRYDYGLGSYSIHADTPFGGAVSSAATQHAENEQQRQYNETGKVMSENEYQAVQTQYQEETFGITEEQLRNQKNQENQKAYEQSKSRSTKNANNTLGQLQNNGAQAHRDALDIIDAIKGKGKAGVVSGLGAGVMSLFDEDNPLFKSLRKKGLRDAFDFMAGEEGTVTEKVVSKGKNIYNEAKAAYGENGLRGVYDYGKQGIKKLGNQGIDFLETKGINVRPYAEKGLDLFRQGKSGAKGLYQSAKAGYAENGIRGALGNIKNSAKSAIYGEAPGMMIMDDGTRVPLGGGKEGLLARGQRGIKNIAGEGRALYQSTKAAYAEGGIGNVLSKSKDALKSTSVGSKITDRIGLAREVNGLAADGVPIARSGLDKAVGVFDGAKAAYAEDGIAGVAKFGKEAGKSGIKGLASDTSGILSKGAEGLKNSYKPGAALGEMASAFNPKNLAGGIGDIAKGLKGGGTLLKGIGRVGGPALMALGPALAFADKASELNPFDGPHYNEDGSEKKALQATGEVMGTTVGAVGGVVGGLEGAAAGAAIGTAILPGIGTAIGAVAGGIAGGWLGDTIFQPIGEAIGGTIGWLGDNLLGGIQNVAGTVWDGLTGAASGVWDAVSGAASGAWDFLTGGGKGDQPVGGLLGLTPIGMGVNAAAGIWNWLSGGDQKNDPYANVENVGQQKNPKSAGQTQNTIVIKNININTEDDPEKIKSALMNLIIEMQEQVNPRQVSRTVGEPPATSSATTDQNQNNTAQAQGTDPQSGTPNGNSTTNTNTNTNT